MIRAACKETRSKEPRRIERLRGPGGCCQDSVSARAGATATGRPEGPAAEVALSHAFEDELPWRRAAEPRSLAAPAASCRAEELYALGGAWLRRARGLRAPRRDGSERPAQVPTPSARRSSATAVATSRHAPRPGRRSTAPAGQRGAAPARGSSPIPARLGDAAHAARLAQPSAQRSRPGSSQCPTKRRRGASMRPSRPRSPAARWPISIGGSRHARSRVTGARG